MKKGVPKVVLRCTHCRARVRLDEPTVGKLADEPGLLIRCSTCGQEFSAAPAAPVADPAPVAVDPPFRSLGYVEPPDQSTRKLSFIEQWNKLSPLRQYLYVGGVVIAFTVAVMAWPGSAGPAARPVAAAVEPLPPTAPVAPAEALPPRFVMTTAGVPLNTLVTADNVHKLFRPLDAKDGPDKAVKSLADVLGKYVVRELQPGQVVTEPFLASAPLRIPEPRGKVEPTPPPAPALSEHVVRIIGQFTITEVTYVQIAPGQWKKGEQSYPLAQAGPTRTPPAPAPNPLWANPFAPVATIPDPQP